MRWIASNEIGWTSTTEIDREGKAAKLLCKEISGKGRGIVPGWLDMRTCTEEAWLGSLAPGQRWTGWEAGGDDWVDSVHMGYDYQSIAAFTSKGGSRAETRGEVEMRVSDEGDLITVEKGYLAMTAAMMP